jgi:hypothetical protein
VAADGGVAPRPARRTRNALLGDRTGAQPSGKVAKYASDRLGLARFDTTAACLSRDQFIAVTETSTGQSLQNATLEITPCFLGEVFEEEGVHGALEPYMKLIDLTLRQGDDRHRGKCHPLEESSRILLVPTNSVERLRINELETAAACFL